MKILIGTPIHQIKDYAMEKWLQNAAKLQKKSPADLLLVDNSPGLEYVEKVKRYLAKYRIKNYKIEHLELPPQQDVYERVARCREIIRQQLLSSKYDAWFSWECDQLIPTNTLDELVRMMKGGNFMMVVHNCWDRQTPGGLNTDMGVTLINRRCLEKYGFLFQFGADPHMPDTWRSNQAWFKKQVLKSGGNYIEVFGVIDPIYHLNE